jgi:hypothetical protein
MSRMTVEKINVYCFVFSKRPLVLIHISLTPVYDVELPFIKFVGYKEVNVLVSVAKVRLLLSVVLF